MRAKHRVTVNLEDIECKRLSALSDRHRVSLAWLGRLAIIKLLDHYEEEEQQLSLGLSTEIREAES